MPNRRPPKKLHSKCANSNSNISSTVLFKDFLNQVVLIFKNWFYIYRVTKKNYKGHGNVVFKFYY